jgi:hypothetical protein
MAAFGTNATYGPRRNNVRSWESNGVSAVVAFGPFMTQIGPQLRKIQLSPLAVACMLIVICLDGEADAHRNP